MARLTIAGFETGDTSEVTNITGGVTASTVQKQTGSYALRVNTSAATGFCSVYGFAASGAAARWASADCYVSVAVRIHTRPGAALARLVSIKNVSGNDQIYVNLKTDGALQLSYFDGSGETNIGSASAALTLDTWYLIEVKGTSLATASSATVELKINGSIIATGTGLTVSGAFRANSGEVCLGNVNSAETIDVYYDDLVVDSAAYPGASLIQVLKPRAAGAAAGWTLGTGSTFAEVKEVPNDGDTTYISSSVLGDASSFAMDSTTTGGISGTVAAVKTVAFLRDLTATASVKVRCRNGSTNNDTTGVTLTTSYLPYSRIDELDPNTGAAWTTGGVDTMEGGVLDNSVGIAQRCTAIYAMVEYQAAIAATRSPWPSGRRTRGRSTAACGSLARIRFTGQRDRHRRIKRPPPARHDGRARRISIRRWG